MCVSGYKTTKYDVAYLEKGPFKSIFPDVEGAAFLVALVRIWLLVTIIEIHIGIDQSGVQRRQGKKPSAVSRRK